ncbi:MAG TPA: hypothetical protein VFY93_02165 [Planctomycetota bacterium]|nr:hypothetical protein [Planctomycetota bacterium]
MRTALLLLGLAVVGCRSYSEKLAEFRGCYLQGDFAGADAAVDRLIAKETGVDAQEVARSNALDVRPGKGNTYLLLLDKAMTQLALGRPEVAVELMREARDQLDEHESKTAKEFFASALSDDMARSYSGADYEVILVRVMLCLADLIVHSSQTEGDAYAYALQVGEKQQQIIDSPLGDDLGYKPREEYRRVGIGAYLQGVILEATGARDGAARAYDRCVAYEPGFATAKEAAQRAKDGHYAAPGEGVLHVFYLAGPGPFYATGRSPPTDLALRIAQIAAALITDSYVPLMQTDVPVPVLAVQVQGVPPLEVTAFGRKAATETLLDVNQVAGQQLDKMMPLILARAVIRRAVKATITTAGSEAVKSRNKNSTGDAAEFGFALANLLWTASERADTRSWSSLPANIQVARLPLPAGVHAVRFGGEAAADVRIAAGRDTYVVVIRPDERRPGVILVDRLSCPPESGADLPEIGESKP